MSAPAFKRALLRIHRHAAKHRHCRDGRVIGQADQRVLDLHDELAGRRENERARERLARRIAERRLLAHQPLQNRQRERQRLAGAGLGARDHVAVFERTRDHGALHRARAFETQVAQTLHQLRMQRHGRKRDRRRVGVDRLPRDVWSDDRRFNGDRAVGWRGNDVTR